ncbi:hypothetical protein ACFFRR_005947 [Megaselia abdita]
MSTSEQFCTICGHQSFHMCQRCRESYCSPQCQILDWPKHKVICIPMPALVPRNPKIANPNSTRLERSVSNTSLNTSLRRPHNESSPMIREKEPITPKNPIELSLGSSEEQNKPKLVNNEKAVLDDQKISELLDKMGVAKTAEPKGWRTLIDCPNDFFEVVIQSINEAKNTIFVMEPKYEQHAVKLLRTINRQIGVNSPSISPEDIREGSLFAAPYEKVYYRAEVISLSQEKKKVSVRLIDYGNEFDCLFDELKASIPIMKNLNAYGLSVRPLSKQKFQADETILIKIVDKADPTGTFSAEIKINEAKNVEKQFEPVSPLHLILDQGVIDCFVSYIFPQNNVVLATFNDNKVGEILKGMHKVLENNEKTLDQIKIGQYLAFKTKLYGWQRGIIKANHGDLFTVYALDFGFMEIVSKKDLFRSIPEDIAVIPVQTVCLSLSSKAFYEKFAAFEFKLKASNTTIVENSLEGILSSDNTDFDKVVIKPWTGNFLEFHATFNPNDAVNISRVVSTSDVFLNLANETVPIEMFKPIAKTLKPIEKPSIEMVLFPVNDEFARGKIIKKTSDSSFQCLDVDTGGEYVVGMQDIRLANDFVKTIPIVTKNFNLAYLMSMTSPYENNKAFTVLERHMNENFVFYLNFAINADGESAGVELLFKDKNCLNKQLLPLIFEKVEVDNTKLRKAKINQPDIPQDVMKVDAEKFLDVSDIEIIGLSTGDNISVMVIDSSTMNTGYFSAFDPKLSVEHMKNYAAKYDKMIVDYAARTDIGSEYCPKNNEVCLAVFDDDGLWYRCFCVERYENDKFLLIFLDYGNFIKTSKSNIRKLSKELMFPSNANSCIIRGFDKSPTLIKQLTEKVVAGQLITLKNVTYSDKEYIVTI